SYDTQPVMMRERSGPVGPLNDDEMKALEPDAVVRLLREWRPAGDAWDDASIAGLAFGVARYVSDAPERARPLADAALNLEEPSYVRGILGGFADAAAKGRPVPWPATLRLARHVAVAEDRDM